ncbi:hypothetical protein RJ639_035393 [Escallonia herrerae]|uniref:RNase H type-1 domain-containing protein n=1 Tax=Escallonia herrerae TaxID=1293975 RepID=A0AA89BCX8_9ASTE|nr:hypothetical protein RJ639_035393 [Escallonia herrerae]
MRLAFLTVVKFIQSVIPFVEGCQEKLDIQLYNIFTTLEIDNLDESVKYTAFLRGLRPTSKFAFSVNKSPPDHWNLYVDGSSALGSSGAGLILISPEGFTIEYALLFGFRASNNEAEYEALLVGIRLAHALKVDSLSVHGDSQLVVNHVLGDYEARDERMAQYLNLVKTSAVKFQNFTICQIPHDQNTQADTLSRLASAEEMDDRRPIYLEILKDRSISSQTEVETIEQEPCWMDMIVTYLSTGELPSERHEARNLRVKAARYALVEGLKKKLDEAKGAWVDELPKVLWAYRTTPHSVTGEMPFLLCYGTEAMLPVEIGVPTIRALYFHEVNNETGLRANLDLLDETQTQAHERSVVIKQRVTRYYNQRVRSKQFQEGDLVLRKLEVSDPKAAMGKLSPNWEGPYRVIKVLKPGAYALGTLSWEPIPRTWNAENLRKYYQ